ncbi:alpha/beta fold hydrolase [Acidilutibacter cellobiosedens]|uniref:Alpha/beta fold hydrolase n=1 Tax=Acidilutibacter cellobiosedens TaxID=2507161 RepID=A0A410QE23_9FIRM|nr:alpha/beta fold hydrolase [Acidilutibacter cellobiosedens]QAT62179.1 alpha/beta fold hydrolase [Acidilutibacter cellobiosedens]
MQESTWIESRGYKILSILEYDKDENKGKNLVVLIHGFVGTKIEPHRMYKKLSERLSKIGYSVVRFDFVGSGDSEGDFKNMTISGEIEDGINVIEYYKKEFNTEKLYILGFSMGGCVASILASKVNSDGLVLWSPVSNPFWNFYNLLSHDEFLKGIKGNDIDYLGDVVGKDFFNELLYINPLEYAKNYKNPVLIIQGSGDCDVLPINSYCYNMVFPNSSVHIIENADHCYSSSAFEKELLNYSVDYFLKNKDKQKCIEAYN